ncbi:MAG: hypothetical protein MUC72_00815 [Acidobacteria bacterium]|jgi:hypothetical protein|nr:hypothetical protein [Acidobacteriota bacterium]
MEKINTHRATVYFAAQDRETAEAIGRTAEESLRLVHDHWGLEPTGDLRLYVMNSWPGFLFHAAPVPWRLALALSFPIWALRVRRLWQVAGGWTQRFGRRLAVGVKPPRLLHAGDHSLGRHVFIPGASMEEKVRHVACHELTHACTCRLGLPAWLNEGLSMVAVDLLLGKATVLPATAAALAAAPLPPDRRGYPAFSRKNREDFLCYFVLGYWRVRFLEETRPGLLKKLLREAYCPGEWHGSLAAAYALGDGPSWLGIDRLAATHFRNPSV